MRFRFWHKWLGILTIAGLLLLTITGWVLNHPDLLKESALQDIVYSNGQLYILRQHSLRLSTPKGEVHIVSDHPIGIGDHLIAAPQGIAILHRDGTLRLYQDALWERILLPEGWPVQVQLHPKQWLLTTTTGVWQSENQGKNWRQIIGPYPESLSSKLHRIHSGHYFGKWGVLWINVTAILTIGLSITGLFLLKKRRYRKTLAQNTPPTAQDANPLVRQ
jgi:hypothetical protein